MVGANVRRLRLTADLSQEQLAERMGVDRAYVSGLELGRRNPTIVTLWHISEALSVQPATLLEPQNITAKATDGPQKRAPRRSR